MATKLRSHAMCSDEYGLPMLVSEQATDAQWQKDHVRLTSKVEAVKQRLVLLNFLQDMLSFSLTPCLLSDLNRAHASRTWSEDGSVEEELFCLTATIEFAEGHYAKLTGFAQTLVQGIPRLLPVPPATNPFDIPSPQYLLRWSHSRRHTIAMEGVGLLALGGLHADLGRTGLTSSDVDI